MARVRRRCAAPKFYCQVTSVGGGDGRFGTGTSCLCAECLTIGGFEKLPSNSFHLMEEAVAANDKGKKAFAKADYSEAVKHWARVEALVGGDDGKTVEVLDDEAVERRSVILDLRGRAACNSAAAHLKLRNDAEAAEAATRAIRILRRLPESGTNACLIAKAFSRRAAAVESTGEGLQQAAEDYEAAVATLSPYAAEDASAASLQRSAQSGQVRVANLLRKDAAAAAEWHGTEDTGRRDEPPADGSSGGAGSNPEGAADKGGGDTTGVKFKDLLNENHSMRLYFRRPPPTFVHAGERFFLTTHVANEFALFQQGSVPQKASIQVALFDPLQADGLALEDEDSPRLQVVPVDDDVGLASVRAQDAVADGMVAVPSNGRCKVIAWVDAPAGCTVERFVILVRVIGADVQPVASAPIGLGRLLDVDADADSGVIELVGGSRSPQTADELVSWSSRPVYVGPECGWLLLAEAPGDLGIGGKLWDGALVLSRWLAGSEGRALVEEARCLELGAGTGLVGLAATRLGASQVVITDMNEVVPLITRNAKCNTPKALDVGRVVIAPLLWGESRDAEGKDSKGEEQENPCSGPFDVVLMSDVVYDPAGYDPLLRTLRSVVEENPACVIIHAYRKRHPEERRFFDVFDEEYDVRPCERQDPTFCADFQLLYCTSRASRLKRK